MLSSDERYIVVIGGYTTDKKLVKKIYVLDVDAMKFIKSSKISSPASGTHAHSVHGGKRQIDLEFTSTLYMFDGAFCASTRTDCEWMALWLVVTEQALCARRWAMTT